VARQCFEFALNDEAALYSGVWGGTSARERRGKRARAAPWWASSWSASLSGLLLLFGAPTREAAREVPTRSPRHNRGPWIDQGLEPVILLRIRSSEWKHLPRLRNGKAELTYVLRVFGVNPIAFVTPRV
jgi:hypothetical protein